MKNAHNFHHQRHPTMSCLSLRSGWCMHTRAAQVNVMKIDKIGISCGPEVNQFAAALASEKWNEAV
jgi:aspartate/methionine/tyrosine aminotransferase